MSEDPYVYAGTSVLRNRLDILEADRLKYIERELVMQRLAEGAPTGAFDLAHLKAIHHHLFQDLYDWAGKVRTVELAKGGSQFIPRQFIETGMADVTRRLHESSKLRGLTAEDFALRAGHIMGDVNHVHPFRDGNGRTQLQYLKQLADQAGHPADLTRLDPERWIMASRAANDGQYKPMAGEIARAIERDL